MFVHCFVYHSKYNISIIFNILTYNILINMSQYNNICMMIFSRSNVMFNEKLLLNIKISKRQETVRIIRPTTALDKRSKHSI